MKVALIEPFYSGSHKVWLDGVHQLDEFQTELFTLPGIFWKWRMHGAAITLAHEVNSSEINWDLLLVSDMLDLALFKSLLNSELREIPIALYMHENQLLYPISEDDARSKGTRDNHYAFINYSSCLVADTIFFNSKFHQESFLTELPLFLGQFPDFRNEKTISEIIKKSSVLHLGLNLSVIDSVKRKKYTDPVILWNHRWEFDKNPTEFFEALRNVKKLGYKFKLVVLGEGYKNSPAVFKQSKDWFEEELIHYGYVKSKKEYYAWLKSCDILPITSNQDFFCISQVEAMYAGVCPIVPNRLVFKEHLSSECHELTLYNSTIEFESLLKLHLSEQGRMDRMRMTKMVAKYDWSKMKSTYLNAFKKALIKKY